ncbi:hypothetical protein Q5M85_12835 [Paraclostridium bifermentans]|nr:hypothetical protein [Paraclostridium bifermentans]
MSGCIEYALSIWNGDSKNEALIKSILRSIKIYGDKFIESINLDNTVDKSEYCRFANSLHSTNNSLDIDLYKYRNHTIEDDFYLEDEKNYQKINNVKLILGILGGTLAFFILALITNFGKLLNNSYIYILAKHSRNRCRRICNS